MPQQRRVYHANPNPDQNVVLQLLDSVIIDARDPRQSSDLPDTSIYQQIGAGSTNTTQDAQPQSTKTTASKPHILGTTTPINTDQTKVFGPQLTVSIENDHHKPPSPPPVITTEDEVVKVKDAGPEEEKTTHVPPAIEINDKPEKIADKSQEKEATATLGASGSASDKVNSWITASEPFFPEASQETPVESALPNETSTPTTVNCTGNTVKDATFPQLAIKPSLLPSSKDLASQVLNLQPGSLDISPTLQQKHSLPIRVGALSPVAQKLADNQDATYAVVSALHQSREAVVQNLADVVKKSARSTRRPGPHPKHSSTPKGRSNRIALDEETVLINSKAPGTAQSDSDVGHLRTVFLPSNHVSPLSKLGGHGEEEQAVRSIEVLGPDPFEEEPEKELWSATSKKLNTISQFTARSSYQKEFHNKAIDKIFKSKKKVLLQGLDKLYHGETLNLKKSLGQGFKHFVGLSLGSQLESTFAPESKVVKKAHYDSFKEWLTKKPLDSYLLGKVDISEIKTEDIKPSLKTEDTVTHCIEEFREEIYELLKGKKTNGDTSSMFTKPRNETDETIGGVFRQVRQYMDFVVRQADKPLRDVVSDCNRCTNEVVSPPCWQPRTPTRDRAYSESSADGSDEDEAEAEHSRRQSKKHKHKKKKRKHKKRSRSPDKRKRHPQHHKSHDPNERFEDDQEYSNVPMHQHKEKPDKHISKDHRTKSSKKKRNKTKIRETGMTHIMDEFYGDVESIVNSAEITGDESTPADQHLPRFNGTGKTEEVLPSHVDHVIKEEMSKTKQCLTEIVEPVIDCPRKDLVDEMEITPEAIINAQLTPEEPYNGNVILKDIQGAPPSTCEPVVEPEVPKRVDMFQSDQDQKLSDATTVEKVVPAEEFENTEKVTTKPTISSTEYITATADSSAEVVPTVPEVKEQEPPVEEEPKGDVSLMIERPLIEGDAQELEDEKDTEEKKTRASTQGGYFKKSSGHSKCSHRSRKKSIDLSSHTDKAWPGRQHSRSGHSHDRRQSKASSPPHRKNLKRKHSPSKHKVDDPMYLVEKHAKKISKVMHMDTTFIDSYMSKSVDVYGESPEMNFDPLFDITKDPPLHSVNPYQNHWAVVQYFLNTKQTPQSDYLDQWLPDMNKFKTSNVRPDNCFLWALSLATGKFLPATKMKDKSVLTDDWLEFSNFDPDMNEYGSSSIDGVKPVLASGEKLITPSNPDAAKNQEQSQEQSQESSSESSLPVGALYRPDVSGKAMKKPMTRNRLALAFKQAVEAKKQGNVRPSPKAMKKQKIGIKMNVKLGTTLTDDKSRAKALEDRMNKEITAIPYDSGNAMLTNQSNENTTLSSSITFEPEMSRRIDGVIEEVAQDFLKDLKNMLSENALKGTIEMPALFQYQGNQFKHLQELTKGTCDMYKSISKDTPEIVDTELADAVVQTVQVQKSDTVGHIADGSDSNAYRAGSLCNKSMSPPVANVTSPSKKKDPIPPMQGSGSEQYVPEEPTSANESEPVPMDLANSDNNGGASRTKTDSSRKLNLSPTGGPKMLEKPSQQSTQPVRELSSVKNTYSLKRSSGTLRGEIAVKKQKNVPPTVHSAKPDSKRESQSVNPSHDLTTDPVQRSLPEHSSPGTCVENPVSDKTSPVTQLSRQEVGPTITGPQWIQSTAPISIISQAVSVSSDKNTTLASVNDGKTRMMPVVEGVVAVTARTVENVVSAPQHFPKSQQLDTTSAIPSTRQKTNTDVSHNNNEATTVPQTFVEVKNEPEETVTTKTPVRFLFSKNATKTTFPKAFTPIVVTTVTITSPLPPALQPVIATSSPTVTTSSLNTVVSSVPAAKALSAPANSEDAITSQKLISKSSDAKQGDSQTGATVVEPATKEIPEPNSDAQPAAARRSDVISSPRQTKSISLVSLNNDIHIPGLGTPEHSYIRSPEQHHVSLRTSSFPTTPAYQGSETPSSEGSSQAFDIDNIPLPPGVSKRSAGDSKWQKWKKTEKWRKDAESENIPPVSTLTQWPPPSPVEDRPPSLPPPPMPPLSITSTWKSKSQSQDKGKPEQPQLPPPPQPQPPQNMNMWYNQQQPSPQQQQQQQQQYSPQWQGWNQQAWGNQWNQGQWGGRGWDRHNQGYWDQSGYWDQHQMPPRHPPPYQDQQWQRPPGDWRHHQYNQWRHPQWGPPPPQQQPQQSHPPRLPPPQVSSSYPSPADQDGPPGTQTSNNPTKLAIAPPGEDESKPVTLGSNPTQQRTLPANDVRMFVFNKDQPICKSVERFLSFMGAKTFDPFNLNVLKLLKSVETLVLVQVEDVHKIHQIPNLLALKQQDWVKFVTYENVSDVQRKTYTPILKSGGLAVMDDNVLLTMQPGSLEEMCEYMMEQRRREGVSWKLVLHGHVMQKLLNVREDDRLRQLHLVLTRYEEEGVVWILRGPDYDNTPRPPQEYLPVTLQLQAENCHAHRHIILLSDLPQTDPRTMPFLRQGISVMNVSSFMRIVIKKLALPLVPQSRPYYGMKADDMFLDTYLSTAVDMLPFMALPVD